jgi:AraC family transcriptional regulator
MEAELMLSVDDPVLQLRSMVSELEEYLRRAAAILETVGEEPPPPPPAPEPRIGLAPWQIRRVLAHVEMKLDTPLRNDDLAAIANLSSFHFCRVFRKSVGVTPHEYIMRRRVERAQGLMLSTDASLSQIAADCGLADQAHLTRVFRKAVGESPSAWRKARATPP